MYLELAQDTILMGAHNVYLPNKKELTKFIPTIPCKLSLC